MRLNAELLRYMTKEEFRVLIAVEMGQKNHEFVPVPLIESIASLKRHSVRDVITSLLKNKLLYRANQKYEGLKLTYLGYDYLALRTFVKRGLLSGVGVRIGVGKESDIHICQTTEGKTLVLKLHRLGRISFRSIKRNRDYLQRRQHASWMYLARLAALKEFFYLKALHANQFPVPEPVDVNRHAVLMEYVDAIPFREVKELGNPLHMLEKLMQLIVRLGRAGVIHGDFNEFNLMIDNKENITLIDMPQMVSTQHPNAEAYFDRDVNCIRNLFERKFSVKVIEAPRFEEVCRAFPPTNFKTSGTTCAAQAENSSTWHGKSFRLEEVLQAEEIGALEEAFTMSRQRRIQDDDTEKNGISSKNYDDTSSAGEDNLDAKGVASDLPSSNVQIDEHSQKAVGSPLFKARQRDYKRRDIESSASDGHSSAAKSESDQNGDFFSEEEHDKSDQLSIPSYHAGPRKHDRIRKRVQRSERKKVNDMGNAGQNKQPERMKARKEMAQY